jgi:hypothetical protein
MKDLTGQRFGRLIASKSLGYSKRRRQQMWECSCDCGSTKVVGASDLQSGNTTSCGCYRREINSQLYAKLNAEDNPSRRQDVKAKLSGQNSHNWLGGVSFGKYCPKFNEALKEEVRQAFDNKCLLCGAEGSKHKLHVHHVDYNKVQGCRGMKWSLVPLCHSCHAKTNHNRWYWFNLLINYWVEKYELPI